jgi:carbonic anhydrase
LDYSVGVVGVSHVVVCGHTGCGGAKHSLNDGDLGPNLTPWLAPVREMRTRADVAAKLSGKDEAAQADILAEENVKMSVENVLMNETVKTKLAAGAVKVHGAIYDVSSAKLRLMKL